MSFIKLELLRKKTSKLWSKLSKVLLTSQAQSGDLSTKYTDKMDKKINEEDYREQLSDLSAKITWDWNSIKKLKI